MHLSSILLMSLLAGAQVGGVSQEERTASIQGVVTRIGSAEPLPRAFIQLSRTRTGSNRIPPITATTDTTGRFMLDAIEAGTNQLFVYKNGFVRQEYGQPQPNRVGTTLELGPGQELELAFSMIPTATISGRIHDSTGDPVANVLVQALQPRFNAQGQRTLAPIQGATTNDLGEYRLFWLNPGDYVLSAAFGGPFASPLITPNSNSVPLTDVPVPTFYPGVVDESIASRVIVSSGQELVGIDLTLVDGETVTVQGRVISTVPGGGVAGSSVTIRSTSSVTRLPSSLSQQVDTEGNFEIRNVPSGSHRITATLPTSIGSDRYSTGMFLDVTNRDIENLVLVITPGFTVSGRIYAESPFDSVIESNSLAVVNPDRLLVILTPREGSNADRSVGRAKEDGSFVIEKVPAGTYQVRVSTGSPDFYVKRIRLGSEEISNDLIELVESPDGSLDILLSANGGRVRGVATDGDGNPLVGTRVVLIPDRLPVNRPDLYKATSSLSDFRRKSFVFNDSPFQLETVNTVI